MFMYKQKIVFARLLIFFMFFSLINCSRKTDSEDTVLVTVGDKKITVREFRSNYEFGLPHLKKDPDRKLSYLNYMIMEKVLSEEGYKLDLDQSERVKKLEKDLMQELLVEELFQTEIKDNIKITPQQIRDAITKSNVKWKLRYWVEPNQKYADQVAQAMKKRGYTSVLDDILESKPEVDLKPKDFETKYLTWLDVSEELLDAVKNLPIGDISDPVEIDGKFFIFQVLDIQREPLREYDYADQAEKYRQILFYKQLKKEAGEYVSNFMSGKKVVTKGSSFKILITALAEYKRLKEDSSKTFIDEIESADETKPALLQLRQNRDQTLVTFENGQWTINEFLKRFNPKSIKVEPADKFIFQNQLNEQIALSVRDYFLTAKAIDKKLDRSENVQKQLSMWRNKWVYEEARRLFTQDVKIDDEQAKTYFEKYKEKYKIRWDDSPTFDEFRNQAKRDAYIQTARNTLANKIDSLKTYIPVSVNRTVLDTISTIESEKSRWQSLQLFKRSSNRLTVPIVDPAWGF